EAVIDRVLPLERGDGAPIRVEGSDNERVHAGGRRVDPATARDRADALRGGGPALIRGVDGLADGVRADGRLEHDLDAAWRAVAIRRGEVLALVRAVAHVHAVGGLDEDLRIVRDGDVRRGPECWVLGRLRELDVLPAGAVVDER